jgi:hypothetical protein
MPHAATANAMLISVKIRLAADGPDEIQRSRITAMADRRSEPSGGRFMALLKLNHTCRVCLVLARCEDAAVTVASENPSKPYSCEFLPTAVEIMRTVGPINCKIGQLGGVLC